MTVIITTAVIRRELHVVCDLSVLAAFSHIPSPSARAVRGCFLTPLLQNGTLRPREAGSPGSRSSKAEAAEPGSDPDPQAADPLRSTEGLIRTLPRLSCHSERHIQAQRIRAGL